MSNVSAPFKAFEVSLQPRPIVQSSCDERCGSLWFDVHRAGKLVEPAFEPESRYDPAQVFGLRVQGGCCRRALLDEGCILLRHLVHLRNCLIHLTDPGALLLAGRADLGHDIRHAMDAGHDFLNGRTRLFHQAAARFHLSDRVANQGLDFPGGGSALLRQAADFGGHDGKAATLLPGTGGFDSGIESKNVGLECYAVNYADDIDDFSGRGIDPRHGLDDFADDPAALCGDIRGGQRQCVGLSRVVRILLDGCSQLLDGRGCFLQRRCLFSVCADKSMLPVAI